jgi:hypothetical protein
MLISPATAQSIGEDFTVKGEQVKIAASETGLYIVRLEDASLATYKGGIAGFQATSPEVTGARKLDVNTDTSQAYLAYLQVKQADLINRIEAKLGRQVDVQFQYLAVLNGMAVAMSQAEAQQVASLPGVLSVRPDIVREMETDEGPEHIGAATIWSGETITGLNTEGEGIVIGMIDSGINHAHPSFAATDEAGYTHTNPYGDDNYNGWCEANPSYCNDKLIAAYGLNPVGGTPEDTDGHGSHTASTAGGNRHTATFNGIDVEIQGVAPHANIVAYKVCNPGCPSTASVAAVELAITADQVDVLNYSISGSDDPWNDDVDLAFLDASAAGIFVSASAGNAGPGAGTVAKTGPWNAAVGASTHGRIVANEVDVTGPAMPPELQDMPSIPGDGVVFTADVNAPLKYDATNNDGCTPFTPGFFNNSYALIQRGTCAFALKVTNAVAAGADGVIVFNNQPGPPIIMGNDTPPFAAPCAMIDLDYGTLLKNYVLANPSTTTIFIAKNSSFIIVDSYADIMADFSSRGPSQFELLKPDYVAPGVNILAAVAADGANVVTYDLYGGTSMSSPHGAGAAALMMALNPTWSPAEIKSALAASADPDALLDTGMAAVADPFDEGSGLLNLTLASRMGLVFDETIANYEAADPSLGGDPKTLNQPSMVNYDCKGTCTWTRTVTSTAAADTTYTAAYDVPAGMTLEVTPATFTIAPGADQELTITADVSGLPFDEVVFASVWLETSDYVVPPIVNTEVTLLEEGFESAVPPAGWSEYSLLTTGWQQGGSGSGSAGMNPHTGSYLAWHNDDTSYDDAWLVSPVLGIPAGGASLTFWEANYFNTWYELHELMISTGSCDPADGDFVQVGEFAASTAVWTQRSVSLDSYAGSDICFAFHYEGTFADEWYLDDVKVSTEIEGAVLYSDLKLPVVVVPTAEFPILTLDPTEISTLQGPDTQMTETLSIGNVGGADLEWSILEAPAGAYRLEMGDGYHAATRAAGPVTDASPKIEAAGAHASVETGAFINADLVLSVDDGTVENNIGIGGTLEFIFLNRFTPDPSVFPLTLNEIHVYFDSTGLGLVGDALSLVVYENTSGNADPAVGSNLLYQQAATITALDAWNIYTLTTPLVLNGPGDVLIGVIALEVPGTSYWPAAMDQSGSQQRSWAGWWNASPPPTPPTLPPNNTWGLIDSFGASFAGNWMVRGLASYAGPCDNPEDVTWLSLDATSGTVVSGGLDEVTVTTDSTGMITGMYNANLCFYSNDPEAPLSVVPVAMEVLGDPCISVDPISLEQTLPVDSTATQMLTLTNSCDMPADFEIVEAEMPTKVMADLLFEGFEAGIMPPAGGWETFHRGATTRAWQVTATPDFVYEGTYAGWVNYDSAAASDEWLLTPVVDTTDLVDLELSFMAISDTAWPTATMKVWVTDADGDPLTAQPLWDMVRDETWGTFVYREVVVDLAAYEGYGDIRVAWQYVGLDGDSFGLDNITLMGAEPAYDIPWLLEDPIAGTVPANGTMDVEVTFDSTGLALGGYDGLLKVINPPYADIHVPVTLHVIDRLDLFLPLILR